MNWNQYKARLASHVNQYVIKVPFDVRQFDDNINNECLHNNLWHLHKQLVYALNHSERLGYTGNKFKKHANLILWVFKKFMQIDKQINKLRGPLCMRLNNVGWTGDIYSATYRDVKLCKQYEIAERLLAYYTHCYFKDNIVSYRELVAVCHEIQQLTGIDTTDICMAIDRVFAEQ